MSKGNKATTIRQIVLVAVMLLFLGGFLLDKFVLWPSHMEKIDEIVNKVTLKLSDENRQQVRDIVGRGPNSTFTYKGIEVEQYRFARGIPGFKRPILDIAFDGDTIAFFRQDKPIDEAYIDNQRGTAKIDASKGAAHPGEGEIVGSDGTRRGADGKPIDNSKEKTDKDDGESSDDSDSEEEQSDDDN